MLLVAISFMAAGSCFAQFSAGLQGSVQDSTGAAVPQATITLVNTATRVTHTTTTDNAGVYRFVSLPPGNYTARAEKAGFGPAEVPFDLSTGQLRDVPIVLQVGSVSATVKVSAAAPLLDTSDSRFAMTLDSKQLEALPNSALSPLASLDLAPGVNGTAGAPDNFEQTNYLTLGANGRGENGNMAVLDGMSVNTDIRGGTISTTPNLDAVQEVAVQTNTYSVDYGAASSIQIAMTTKSGTNQYHGSGSDYYQYEKLNARGYYGPPHPDPIPAYHINNMSFTLGGPIIPRKQLFFFAAYEPYENLASNAGGLTWVTTTDATIAATPGGFAGQTQGFTEFLKQANPASPEVGLMTAQDNMPGSTFKPAAPVDGTTYNTAAEVFNGGSCPVSGNLGPQYLNVPCGFVINQAGNVSTVNKNSDAQYSLRIDKAFGKDRLYGSWFRSTIANHTVSVIPSSNISNPSWTWALQGDETHTFSSMLLNEAEAGYSRLQGEYGEGDYDIPHTGIPGGETTWGGAYGYNWIEHNEHFRDSLMYIRGSHSFKIGGESWHGDDIALFAAVGGIPTLSFYTPYDFVNDQPDYESGLYYNYQTGAPQPWQYDYVATTYGAFAEDTWKATRRLTLEYGIRYDNFGNPHPTAVHGDTTTQSYLSNFIFPQSGSLQQQVENGVLTKVSQVFAHDMNWIFSPRAGFALDLRGDGKWVVRGGFGLYRELFTLGNAENGLRNNPPG
ncbi:MAG: TonB-dependent receptor, partial [Acidobacteriaceae bacterium]